MVLPPLGCSFGSACEEIEDSADGTHMTMDIEFVPMTISPFFLFGCRHSNPQQIRISIVDSFYDSFVVLGRKLRLIRRRIGDNVEIGIYGGRLLSDERQHPLRGAHEHYATLCSRVFTLGLSVESLHLESKKVPSCYALYGL